MAEPLGVLVIGDAAEARRVRKDLERGGFAPSLETADVPEAVRNALNRGGWDLIVFAIPPAQAAPGPLLDLLRGQEQPFIILADPGAIDYKAASDLGAADLVYRGDPDRMLFAVRREARRRKGRGRITPWLTEDSLRDHIIACMRDGLAVIDRDFRIVLANQVLERNHAGEMPLAGKKCHQVFHGRAERCESCPTWRCLETGQPAEGFIPAREGQDKWLYIQAHPIVDGQTGTIAGVLEFVRDVSSEMLNQKELAAEKERLTVTLYSIADAVVTTDREGRIAMTNPAAEELTGWSGDEAAGRFLSEVFRIVDAATGRAIDDLVRRTLTGGPIKLGDQMILCARDGSRKLISITGAPIKGQGGNVLGVVLIFRDVTQSRRTEQELAFERDLLHTLMDNIPDFIYFKDANSRYTRVNTAEALNLGLKNPEEAIGRTVFDFFPEDLAKASYEDEQRIVRTGHPLINKVEQRTTGGASWVLTTKVPILGKDGAVTGIVGISRDITERKRAEEELTLSLDKLRKSMEGAIQAMALTVEIRDPYTAGHQRRVAQLAYAIAKEMGLPAGQVDGIRLAAAIHDIGKIYIPAEILSKPGRITETEFSMIRTHPQVGYDILKTIEFPWPIAAIVLQHHKRLDGSGYPVDLPDKEMLLEARILSVADVVEAMSSHRPYRPALGIDKALREISQNSGVLYDASVVLVCLKLFTEKGFSFE